ncbi:MAG: fatty acid metabolism transcriptional regulator FadR [Anaerolineales bacterium]|nr:fatty acid metabolism transcriptional regulator FadR [Anaerolineales bacterium]
MEWDAPPKPTEFAENRLIDAILDGHFPIGSALPAERELAIQLGVTRPTLREALQRMACDGWVEIHHGRATRVRNFWEEGSLGVLSAIATRPDHLPADFVANLLVVRLLMAPTYTHLAIERAAPRVIHLLDGAAQLPDQPEALAAFDWQLHHLLTVASGNPIFTLILNGFSDLYQPMAVRYFQNPAARQLSRAFYTSLLEAAQNNDADGAEDLARQVMRQSLDLWNNRSS